MGIVGELTDLQVVVGEDFLTALDLYVMVAGAGAPAHKGFLIAPTRQGQNPSRSGQTAIPDVVDEPVHDFQFGPQHLGVTEVGIPLLGVGVNLKEDSEHFLILPAADRHARHALALGNATSAARRSRRRDS